MSISFATLDTLDDYRAAATRITDTHTRVLVEAWVEAWDGIAGELEATLTDLAAGAPTQAQLRRSRKLAAALDIVGAQLDGLTTQAGVLIVGDLPTAMQLAGNANAALLRSQLPSIPGVSGLVVDWDKVDPRSIAAIINRTTQRIHATSLPLSAESVAVMRRNLIRGLVVGDNPREVARRMLLETQGTFEGGLTRALRISRTEMLDAMREASRLSDEANADLMGGWTWTASLSARTCPACWALHGTDFSQSQPGPEGHPNCRCTRVPRLKTWDELGFLGIEEPPSLLPDAEATFSLLTPAEQLAILGPARFEAWQAGDYPMSAWATRRVNPDWRPSWVITPAPRAA